MEARRWRATCQEVFEKNAVLPEAAKGKAAIGKGRVAIPNRFVRLRYHAGKGLGTAEISIR